MTYPHQLMHVLCWGRLYRGMKVSCILRAR
ncbi:hypothetical protein [Paenibacillus solani]